MHQKYSAFECTIFVARLAYIQIVLNIHTVEESMVSQASQARLYTYQYIPYWLAGYEGGQCVRGYVCLLL
jgi:hypothetical protein